MRNCITVTSVSFSNEITCKVLNMSAETEQAK